MAVESEGWVGLATRIPKSLHRELRLHCLKAETTMMHFLVAALREQLAKGSRGTRQRTKVNPRLRARQNKTAAPNLGRTAPN
jgi:hypothetical protein